MDQFLLLAMENGKYVVFTDKKCLLKSGQMAKEYFSTNIIAQVQ